MSRTTKNALRRQLSSEKRGLRPADIALNASTVHTLLESIELRRPAPQSATLDGTKSTRGTIRARKFSQASANAEDAEQGAETLLRLFDLNPCFGPYLGIERIARWKRAKKFGLEPPVQVLSLIKQQAKHVLRDFDLNPRYGPHMGIGRLERWERANEFGLGPPVAVRHFLEEILVDEQPPQSRKLRAVKPGLQSIRSLSKAKSGRGEIRKQRLADRHALERAKPRQSLSRTSRKSMPGPDSVTRHATTDQGALDLDGLTEQGWNEKPTESLNKWKRQHRKQKPANTPSASKDQNVAKGKGPPPFACDVQGQGQKTRKRKTSQCRRDAPNPNGIPVDISADPAGNRDASKQGKRGLPLSDPASRGGLHKKQRSAKAAEKEERLEAEAAVVLRQFDLNSRFGPYAGIDRLTRWRRAAQFGLDPPPEVRHLIEIEVKETLRMFDLNAQYGPFVGIDRLERWNRAKEFGLNPPNEVKRLIEESCKAQAPKLKVPGEAKLGLHHNLALGVIGNACVEQSGVDLTEPSEVRKPALPPTKKKRRKGNPLRAFAYRNLYDDGNASCVVELAEPVSPPSFHRLSKLVPKIVKKRKARRARSFLKAIQGAANVSLRASADLIRVPKPALQPPARNLFSRERKSFEKAKCFNSSTSDDHAMSEAEHLLRQFDLNPRFGPYRGVDRLERWYRAARCGLNPPLSMRGLLEERTGKILRLFDLNSRFGPFLGMNRLERWKRAKDFGLNPPIAVRCILESSVKQQSYAPADSLAMRISHRYPRSARPAQNADEQ